MKPVVLLPRAEVDLFDAAIWYENEREGLGPAFEADSDRLVSRIEWSPFQFSRDRPWDSSSDAVAIPVRDLLRHRATTK